MPAMTATFSNLTGNQCALCDTPLNDDNDSVEHVIPQSIGGRYKVSGFICKICNNFTGKTWDADVAKQLHPIALFLGISRERGKLPSMQVTTIEGDKFCLHGDLSLTLADPVFEQRPAPGNVGTEYKITARSWKEFRGMLDGLKKKHPNFDKDSALQQATETLAPVNSVFKTEFSVGRENFGKSIIKTAFAMASRCGVPHAACRRAKGYLSGKALHTAPPYGAFYLRDLLRDRQTGKFFHCVALMGDPDRRRLIAYVEYFGMWRFVIVLDDDYRGEPIESSYAIDPISGEHQDLSVDLHIEDNELSRVLTNDAIYGDTWQRAMHDGFAAIMARRNQREWELATMKAYDAAVAEFGKPPGTPLSDADRWRLAELFTKHLMPNFLRRMTQRPV